MEASVESVPAYKIAFMRQVGPYGAGNIQLMEKLKEWAKRNSLLDGKAIILGISLDNPETTNPWDCRYDTGLVIPKDLCLAEGEIQVGYTLGGQYLVFTITHTAEALQKAWGSIFVALSQQNFQLDEGRPIFERYRSEMIHKHCCEICVPIRTDRY